MSKIYQRATEIYRQEKLGWYKRIRATGWDSATLKDVAHLEMDEPKMAAYALAKAIEEALCELNKDAVVALGDSEVAIVRPFASLSGREVNAVRRAIDIARDVDLLEWDTHDQRVLAIATLDRLFADGSDKP